MDNRPAIALHWLGSCGGCEESVLDLAEELTSVTDRVRIAFCPMLTDAKSGDLEAQPDGALLAAFISGCVITEEHAEAARLLRRKSRLVVAFGACAHLGGVPGLANQMGMRRVADMVGASGAAGASPSHPALPPLADMVRTLDQVIQVDHYLPGCPPTAAMFGAALEAIAVRGEPAATRPAAVTAPALEPGGLDELMDAQRVAVASRDASLPSVLAPDIALCDECPRKETRGTDTELAEIRRVQWTEMDADICLLNQGILCLGPGTRSGCGAACIRANMPCTGCFGPTSGTHDHGGKLISAAAAAIAGDDAEAIRRALAGLADPVGSFYRYSLPGSLLRGRRA